MTNKTKMSAKEFIRKILQGERDFRNIDLSGQNFDGVFDLLFDLNFYLILENKETLPNEPIILNNSDLSGIISTFNSFPLPYVRACKANFSNAKIPYANFSHGLLIESDFTGVYAPYSDFECAVLTYSKMNNSYMKGSQFSHSILRGVEAKNWNIRKACLYKADITGLKGIDPEDEDYVRSFYSALFTTAKTAKRRDIFYSNDPKIIANKLLEIVSFGEGERKSIEEIIEKFYEISFWHRTKRALSNYLKNCLLRSLEYRI